jgi:hypothetical protein
MKRILLTLALALGSTVSFSQVIFSGESPVSIQGAYAMTYAPAGADWAAIVDLLDPANAVLDELVLISDGTPADSLGCNPAVNGVDVAGKIAVVYRGECQFGTKALNAQNAGAIAVVIINNAPGGPVGMAAGDDGPSVTIPTVMIGDASGAILVAEMANGPVEVFIGNKTGFYPNDIGLLNQSILKSKASAMPALLAQTNADYEFQVGAWVYNFGFQDQTNVSLTATAELGGVGVYNETSINIPLLEAGDSVYLTLPDFSLATYSVGYYDFFYTVDSDSIDSYEFDNELPAHFYINESDFSYATYNRTLDVPNSSGGFRSTAATSSYSACIAFRDPNASRVAATGITFASVIGASSIQPSLDGEPMTLSMYRYDDVFTDLNDAPNPIAAYTLLNTSEYYYPGDLQGEMVTGYFTDQIVLQDNQRYFFCVTTYNSDLFIGFDPNADYTLNGNLYLQPYSPIESNGSFNPVGFGFDAIPGIAVKFMDAALVNLEADKLSIDMNVYPNPASNQVMVDFKDNKVNFLEVLNIAGQRVIGQDVNTLDSAVYVDVNGLDNGVYMFKMHLENGMSKAFRVVVSH